MMEFGAEFPANVPLKEVIEYSKLCEESGLDCIWVTDMLARGELWVTLTAIALNTRHIKLGADVTNPYTRHPAITAQALSTLQEIAEGRAILGIGSGMKHLLEQMGIKRKEPKIAIGESIEIIKGLLTGREVNFNGKVFNLKGLKLPFSPSHPQPPFYVAAISLNEATSAAEVADGLITISANTNYLNSMLQKAKGLKVAAWIPFRMTEDIQAVKDDLGITLSQIVVSLPDEVAAIMDIGEPELENAHSAIRCGSYATLSHRIVGDFALFGDSQSLIQKLKQIEETGIDQLILSFGRKGDIVKFSQDVAPAFR